MKIIVLDYEVGSVEIFNYSEDFGDAEEYLQELHKDELIGNPNQCHYMVVSELKLQIH